MRKHTNWYLLNNIQAFEVKGLALVTDVTSEPHILVQSVMVM
jgi:hypothetical protein